MLARLISFATGIVRNGAKLSESKVNTGGGFIINAEHFASPGDDSYPLAGDIVNIVPLPRSSGNDGVATGYADVKNTKKAQPGDKRIYSRTAEGIAISEVWLKNTGEIVVSNANGTFTLEPGGTIDLNGVRIDPSGNITTPGTITASDATLDGKVFSEHLHGGVTSGGSNTLPPN